MSNIKSDLDNLIKNLSTNYTNITNNYSTLKTNISTNKYVNKTGDTMTGTLNITNIDNPTNLYIGQNATTINLGSTTGTDQKNILLNGDNINLTGNINNIVAKNDFNLNNNKLINVSNATLNDEAVNVQQMNSLTTTAISNVVIPNSISSLTGLNTKDLDLNNNKLINVANGTNNNDTINLSQANNIINNGIINLSSSKISGFSSDNTNVTLGDKSFSKITNTHINDGTISASKLSNYPNTINSVYKGDGTFSKITNNNITDGTINSSKLVGYPNDGTKYLSGDGTFKTITNNTTLTQTGINIETPLYTFSSFTFNNCGATGLYGPTKTQMLSNYSATTWTQNSLYLDMTIQGFQIWTVPVTGSYQFTVAGAAGGTSFWDASFGSQIGGRGVIIRASIQLSMNQKIYIASGQLGLNRYGIAVGSGGGGGTFVWYYDSSNNPVPLIIAGGGGGAGTAGSASYQFPGVDASYTTSGRYANNYTSVTLGINGNGGGSLTGSNNGISGAGAGWFTKGNNGTGTLGGKGGNAGPGLAAYNPININCLAGGLPGTGNTSSDGTWGGFGGGGGTGSIPYGNSTSDGGGGGGYSGGSTGSGFSAHGGGGGGSYTISTATNISNYGYNSGHGYVTVSLVTQLPNITTYTFNPSNVKYVSNTNANLYNINNLSNPTNLQDAVTKYYIDNTLFNSINTYLTNNSIKYSKISIDGLGNKVLYNDGIYRSINNNIITYTGSLSNINAKLLIITTDSNMNVLNACNNMKSNFNTIIGNLGGIIGSYSSSTGIYVNVVYYSDISNFGTNGYDSNYDAVLYWSDSNIPPINTANVLNNWYTSQKGVVLGVINNITLTKTITTLGTLNTGSYQTFKQSSTDTILTNISNITPKDYYTIFTSINNSIGIGNINGINAINYYSSLTNGRRVDLNWNPYNILNINDYTINGITRATLQALLWSANKI